MSGGDNNFGIQVTVDASGATDGSRTFQRSAQDIATSAKTATDGAKNLNNELKNLGGSAISEALESIKGSLEGLNTALKALGIGAVVVEFRELFEIGKELEDELIHLQIASGQTGDQMKQLEESTVSLSNAFGQSQIKVVAAQITAAKAGFADLNDNTKVTTASLELAKIGFSDAGTAAKTLTEVMQAYGVSADGAKSVSESLFVATQKGNLDIGQLGQVFERIAPSAQAAGLSINQVLATLRALGTVESPQRAVLGITQLLKDISEPSDSAQKSFDRISASLAKVGIQAATFKDLVSQQGFIGALKSINEVTGGNQADLSKALGNPQAGITAYALLNQASKQYGDSLTELVEKQKTAAEASDRVTESTSFQAEQFRSRVQNSFIGLAGSILESLTPAFKFLNENFQGLATAAEALAALLSTRLVVAALSSAAALVTERIAATEAAIATGEIAVASSAAAIGLEGMGVAATAASLGETLAATATADIGIAIEALGGPITLILGLLAAAAIAWYNYGDATKAALKDTDNLKSDLDRLASSKATQPDAVTKSDASGAEKRRDDLQKEIERLQSVKTHAGDSDVDSEGNLIGFTKDDQKKLDADYDALSKLNEQLDRFNTLKNLGTTQRFDPGLVQGAVDVTDAAPAKQEESSAATLGKNKQLQDAYTHTFDAVNKLANATKALNDIQKTPVDSQGDKTVGSTPLNASGQRQAEESLRAEIVAGTDAITKNARALATLEAANDPVAAVTNKFKNELHNLNNEQTIAQGSTAAYAKALADLRVKEAEDLTTANAKVASLRAVDDVQKAYINTVATQTIRILELNKAFAGNTDSKEYAAAIADVALQLDKAALSTQALSSGQLKLAQSQLALRQAQQTAANSTGTDEDKAKFIAEAQVATDDAARSSDTLALRVQNLAGQYEPLIAIQKKYADQLDQINSLQRARPDFAPALESTKALLPLQAKQEADKATALPAADKSGILANDEYNISIQKINNDLVANRITQTQANQAILEAKQALDASSQAFDNFAKAGVEAGKAIGDSFTEFLIKPTEGLRGLLDQVAKGLQASAAGIVSKQIQGAAYSSLANSSSPTLSKLGTNLASGAGVQLTAKGADLTEKGLAKTASQAVDSSTDKALEDSATAASAPDLGAVASGADTATSAAGDTALSTAGTTLASAGTTLDAAATSLSAAASALTDAAASLSSGGDSDELSSLGDDSGGDGSEFADIFSSLGEGEAGGGDVSKGSSHLVGETGPEVVSFGANAHVTPNEQVRQAVGAAASGGNGQAAPSVAAPDVHVHITNVSDPNDVPAGMGSAAGEKVILNTIARNRGTVKSQLGS